LNTKSREAIWEQGIEKGERKSIMNSLSDEIIKKYHTFNLKQKMRLAGIILEDLKTKISSSISGIQSLKIMP